MEVGTVGIAAAFSAGFVSFASPCVLPLVPAYMSYVVAQPLHDDMPRPDAGRRVAALMLSACFVLGFSAVFVTLGAGATYLGGLLLRHRVEANLAGGMIIIVFGLLMLGVTRGMPWAAKDVRFRPRLAGGRPLPAFVLGAAFGFGWTPCIGPILGAILTVSAVQTSIAGGMGLLATYAAGLGVPFMLVAVFAREFSGRIGVLRRFGTALQVAAGLVLVLMGLAMITGQLSVFAYWLLETFPALGRIG